MIVSRQITLPQDAAFYEQEFEYDVIVDSAACGNFVVAIAGKPVTFTYSLNPILEQVIRPLGQGKSYSTTLENVLDATARYFRTGNPQFSMPELLDQRFLLARDFGFAFRHTKGKSLAHENLDLRKLHSERTKQVTELLGYGLTIDFARQLFDLPPERFFFINGAGARADFRSHLSYQELTSKGGNVALVSRSGHVFNLEVKAFSGWESYRTGSVEGRELLHGIHAKAASSSRGLFLAAIAALPEASKAKNPVGRCRIVLADPGDPLRLGERDQLVIILNETLTEVLRLGLWPTAWWILRWLRRLDAFSQEHNQIQERLDAFAEMRQYTTESRTVHGIKYWGRTFSEALTLLGSPGNRGLTRQEAVVRLETRHWGWFWFSGLHQAVISAIPNEDTETMLSFHVGLSQARGPRGAVYFEFLEPDVQLEREVENEYARALSRSVW